ncbi:MAG TPA: riboflavin synthase, partial [Saprospiraceae bacterium]|nr:riboflavin synthase [Saprospiraceae bacterium]
MFTGIIESLAEIKEIQKEGSNYHFRVQSPISKELKVDQSLAHDGVCLTVTQKDDQSHWVTAIAETLQLTSLSEWQPGKLVNLERAMVANGRLDGHFVQGHVDSVGICRDVLDVDGSAYYTFEFDEKFSHLIVPKGSITVNGVSLTVVEPTQNRFKVAIIPFTVEHTNFQQIQVGTKV